jgi:acetoacetyl-CoA reductase
MTAVVPPDIMSGILARQPIGRFGQPEEVAAVVAWLCSDDGGYLAH